VVPADTAPAIAKAWEIWLDAFEGGDADTLAGLFTEDGLYAANAGQVLSGRDGIREGVLGWVDRRAVYRLSRFMIRVEPSRCAMDAGHIVSIWRKQPDSAWRIESILGNRSPEPPQEACGGQRRGPEVQRLEPGEVPGPSLAPETRQSLLLGRRAGRIDVLERLHVQAHV